MRNQYQRMLLLKARRVTAAVALALGMVGAVSLGRAEPGYESCFMFLWCDPHEEKPGFLDGNEQIQGLAHDEDNWFISAGEYMHCGDGSMTWGLWKVPVASGLIGATPTHRFVISDRPDLQSYFHVGDIDCFNGFVLAPVENYGCAPVTSGTILFLDTADLHCVGKAVVPGFKNFGWLAVHPVSGEVYVSEDSITDLVRCSLDWPYLLANRSQTNLEVSCTILGTVPLSQTDGTPFIDTFSCTQGGAFSESGDLFYFLVGCCDEVRPLDGIHVFDTTTWREVRRSFGCHEDAPPCNNECMDFRYYWETATMYWNGEWYCTGSEPEGIDYWDLDDKPGPYWGQLHVGWLDNDGGRQDDVTLWHYTHTLRVDAANTGPQDGRPNQGFRTVGQAYNRICDGTSIKITPNFYNETLTLTKRVRLVSAGPGVVTIGRGP